MRTTPMTEKLYEYVMKHTDYAHPVLPKVEKETMKRADRNMQISRDQGKLMNMLIKLMGAKRAIEVGCFTGYSAISVASALPKDGLLISLDIDPEVAKIAQGFFVEAGVHDRVQLRVGSASQSFPKLMEEFGAESFDFAFIDADKEGYPDYYEACLRLIRPGGLIVIDNVIWGGAVIDYTDQSQSTQAIRRINEIVERDERVERVMLHISDGLLLCRKKTIL